MRGREKKKDRQMDGQTDKYMEIALIEWFAPKMLATYGAGQGPKPEPGMQSSFSTKMIGTQLLCCWKVSIDTPI